jgi:MarR family transcriptional regulator, transcriptional regulator for hemolysin
MRYVGRLLKFTAKEGSEVVERRLQAAGGSLVTWLILQSLGEQEGELQRQLAERLCIEGPTMTRHLDRLEAEGLIERRPDPADRRGTRVHATELGRQRHSAMREVMERSERDLLEGMSEDEEEMFESLLKRVRENVWHAAVADAKEAGRPEPPHPLRMEQRHVADAMAGNA